MHPSKDPHVVMSSMETSQVLAFLQALSRVCSVPRAQYAVASFAPGSAAPSGGSAELCPRLEDLLSIAREGSSLQVMEAEDPFNENFACVDGLRYSEAQAVRLFWWSWHPWRRSSSSLLPGNRMQGGLRMECGALRLRCVCRNLDVEICAAPADSEDRERMPPTACQGLGNGSSCKVRECPESLLKVTMRAPSKSSHQAPKKA